jgi:hypothetical protein
MVTRALSAGLGVGRIAVLSAATGARRPKFSTKEGWVSCALIFGGIADIAIAASEKFLETVKYDGLPVNKPISFEELKRLP